MTPSRLRAAELILFLLCLIVAPPYRNARLDAESPVRWNALKDVNLALGLTHRGVWPCYSHPVSVALGKAIVDEPDAMIDADLRAITQPDAWPPGALLPFPFTGSEAGMSLSIHALWSSTGSFTLGTIVHALELLHMLAALVLLVVTARLGVPFAGLVAALLYAYSPLAVSLVFGFGVYVLSSVFIILATGAMVLAGRGRVWWAVLCGLLLAVGGVYRSTAFYALAPVVAGLAILGMQARLPRMKILAKVAIVVVTALGTRTALNAWMYSPERLAHTHETGHAFWHAIWAGLGEVPNAYGFEYGDFSQPAYVRSVDPSVAPNSAAYEAILRARILDVLRADPGFFVRTIVRRIFFVAGAWPEAFGGDRAHPIAATIVLIAGLIALGWQVFRRGRWELLATVLPLLGSVGVPVLAMAMTAQYNLEAYLGLMLAVLVGIAATIHDVIRRVRG